MPGNDGQGEANVSISCREVELPIMQVGWVDQQQDVALVLVSKKHRRLLGVYPGLMVSVWKRESPMEKVLAVVSKQFRAQIEGVTPNVRLARQLGVEAGGHLMLGNVVIADRQGRGGDAEPEQGAPGREAGGGQDGG